MDVPCPFTSPPLNQWPTDGTCYSMNTNGMSAYYNPVTCNSGNRNDAWAWFVGDGNNISVTYTPDTRDAVLHVWDVSGGCGALISMGCSDVGGNGVAENVTFASTAGTPYLVRVQRWNSNNNMTGQLCVTSIAPGAPGDDCTNPIRVDCGDILTGESTIGNGNTESNWSCGTVGPYPGEDRFYVIQWPDGTSGGTIRINFTNVVDADTYFEMFYLGTSCAPNTCTDEGQFNITTGTITGSALTYWEISVPAGIQDHYFVIDSQNDGVDSYDMEVTCFATGISLDQTNNCGGGSSPCNYSLEMYDSYGDGWNGGYIDLFVNAVNTGPHSAAGTGTITPIAVATGNSIQLDYTAGSWENENSFVLRDGRNLALHAETAPPNTGTLYTTTVTDISCGFDPANPNSGVYSTWQQLDGSGIPIGNESTAPPTFDPSVGGQYKICENIYLENPGWEWLKDAVITVGDCWTNITGISPNGTGNGFYNWGGDWTGSWNAGTREITYTFSNSINASWGDGNTNNYTCNLYRFCYIADIDPACSSVNGFQNSLSVTDDGIGGSGGSTGAANVFVAATSSTTNSLPVELVMFSANKSGNKENIYVQLDWITASEINNDYFSIERSIDTEHFEEIIKQKGAGNSNTLIKYTAYDYNPHYGINYYRLKQTDYDGKFAYSNIVSINIAKDIISVYPNPTTGKLTVNATNLNRIEVVDLHGRILLNFDKFEDNIAVFDMSTLPKGIYYIKITSRHNVFVEKIILK